MTVIALIGQETDHTIERLIKNRLSETYGITYIKKNSLSRYGKGYEILCFDSEVLDYEKLDNPIILLKETAEISDGVLKTGTAIISSDKKEHVRSAEKSGIKTITCGFSHTSTISFTSETEGSLLISLNRSITALSGREIEPLEIPVKKTGEDIYSLMSFTALRLLLDDFGSDIGRLY